MKHPMLSGSQMSLKCEIKICRTCDEDIMKAWLLSLEYRHVTLSPYQSAKYVVDACSYSVIITIVPKTVLACGNQIRSNGVITLVGKRKGDEAVPSDVRTGKRSRPDSTSSPSGGSGPTRANTLVPASAAAPQRHTWVLPPPEPLPALSTQLGLEEVLLTHDMEDDGNDAAAGRVPRMLEATQRKDRAGRPVVVVSCTTGGKRLWSDELSGRPAAITGSLRFAAVAMMDGNLYVSAFLRLRM